MIKNENLFKWINANNEGFTIAKASGEANMPNATTCSHVFAGLVKAGLLAVAKVEKDRVFSKTANWDTIKANGYKQGASQTKASEAQGKDKSRA